MILENAKKYQTKTEWYLANPYAYKSARRFGVFGVATAHMPEHVDMSGGNNPFFKWTEEMILESAKKHQTINEWRHAERGAYKAAKRLGCFSRATVHMINGRKRPSKWTHDLVLVDAQKYKTKMEWYDVSHGAYQSARNNGWFEEATAHMTVFWEKKWDEVSIRAEAAKYKTRKEWFEGSQGSYNAAKHLGIFDSIAPEATFCDREIKWTEMAIREEASKYKTRQDWWDNSGSSCNAARRLGIFESVAVNMKASSNTSSLELSLLEEVKKGFPKAHRTKMGKSKPGEFGKCFELDIYIPELRKAIEFDGTYWHSPKGLRRSREDWPEEMIQNYHQIKDDFFARRGISILHIKEADWLSDPASCLSRVKEFLGWA